MLPRKVKYKRENDPIFISFKNRINQYGNTLPIPDLSNVKPINIKNSWYTNKIFKFNTNDTNNNPINIDYANLVKLQFSTKAIKIRCYPNEIQINILINWFKADIELYNATVLFLRKTIPYIFIQQYKKSYGKKKYSYICQKQIDTLNHKKNIIKNKKNNATTILNKKLMIRNKSKKDYEFIIDKKKQISKLNEDIAKINIEITKFIEKKNSCNIYVDFFNKSDVLIKKYTDYKYLRSNELKTIRDEIYNKYKDFGVLAHSLDASIKRACTSYKSGITNLLENNCRRFRVRCLSNNNKGMIEIEKQAFNFDKNEKNYQICKKTLGCMEYKYNNREHFITIPSTSYFSYDGDKYWLLYSTAIEEKTNIEPKKLYAGVDPGIRTFNTIFTPYSIVNYGTDVYSQIREYLLKIDKLKTKHTIEEEILKCNKIINKHVEILKILKNKRYNEITDKNIKRLERQINFNEERIKNLKKINGNDKKKEMYEKNMNKRKEWKGNFYYDKIKRKVTELHWKTANDLAKNYENVIIGRFSMKSICEKDDVCEMVKRVGTLMRHYDFRTKLVYKCLTNKTKILVSSEKYTTKMCSICGHYNDKIKGEKEINCEGCKKKYPRDGYAARGIVINNLKIK